MRYKYDLHNLGREIGHTVRNAIKLEDVQQLQGSIDDIVRELSQVGREFTESKTSTTVPPRVKPVRERAPREQAPRREKTVIYDSRPIVPAAAKSPKSVNGIVLTILGTIFAGLSTVPGIILAAFFFSKQLMSGIPGYSAAINVIGGLFTIGAVSSTFMLVKGSSLRKRVKRYAAYLKLFNGCKLYPIEQLSIITDCPKRVVLKDLRRMLDAGKLPGAHLDMDKTSIILDEETYTQYLAAEQKSRELLKLGKKKKPAAMPEPQPIPEPQAGEVSPADAVIVEGRAYIDRISATNPIINNEEVSGKIDRIVATVSKIFDYVSEHPEKQGDLRRLMNYYLPTTLKLLEAYSKFEAHAVRGENVSTAMHEIEGALNTISLAFENLLDDLFEHEMYDITSDISALETMLAQEGLTAQDFAAADATNKKTQQEE